MQLLPRFFSNERRERVIRPSDDTRASSTSSGSIPMYGTMNRSGQFEREFTEVFETRFAALFRYVNRLSGDTDLARDIAQETFVRLYQRASIPADLPAWLATVANNLLRDEIRTTARRSVLLAEHALEPRTAGPQEMPDVALIAEERSATVRAALGTLSPRDREMLLLRHSGYSYREIARVLGLADASVGTMLARATQAFVDAFTALPGQSHA